MSQAPCGWTARARRARRTNPVDLSACALSAGPATRAPPRVRGDDLTDLPLPLLPGRPLRSFRGLPSAELGDPPLPRPAFSSAAPGPPPRRTSKVPSSFLEIRAPAWSAEANCAHHQEESGRRYS